MESLSSYARQFLGQMEKPDVDEITGLSPAISIDQKTTSHNPRSTVGTVTEIYDYLRLMYARIGVPHCPICGREITQQTVDAVSYTHLDVYKRQISASTTILCTRSALSPAAVRAATQCTCPRRTPATSPRPR